MKYKDCLVNVTTREDWEKLVDTVDEGFGGRSSWKTYYRSYQGKITMSIRNGKADSYSGTDFYATTNGYWSGFPVLSFSEFMGKASSENTADKFKVGDEVRITGTSRGNCSRYVGKIGIITDCCGNRNNTIGKHEDTYHTNIDTCYISEFDLELVNNSNNKTMIKSLGIMVKKLLDGDTQKLMKAGFINGDLDLTDEGKKQLMAVLFMENKDALVKAAEEVIKDAEDKE